MVERKATSRQYVRNAIVSLCDYTRPSKEVVYHESSPPQGGGAEVSSNKRSTAGPGMNSGASGDRAAQPPGGSGTNTEGPGTESATGK